MDLTQRMQNYWGYDAPVSGLVGFNLLSIETLAITVYQVDSMSWFLAVLGWLVCLTIGFWLMLATWWDDIKSAYFKITKWIWITTIFGLGFLIWLYPFSVIHLMDWSISTW